MASGNSAQSAARQQNIAFQFSFSQRSFYHITVQQPSPSTKAENIDFLIRHEQAIQREAGLMARYRRCISRLIHGLAAINADPLDRHYVLFIAKRLLEAWEENRDENQLIAPFQIVQMQLHVDKLAKLIVWLEAVVRLVLGI